MRHKYTTPALVLARRAHGEADGLVTLATSDFGVIRARATGLRKTGSKMSVGLQTFTESDVMLVRGKEGWRLTGAIPVAPWALSLGHEERERAGRISELIVRLSQGEDAEPRLFSILKAFMEILPTLPQADADAAECLAALRVLRVLGHDAGELPGDFQDFGEDALREVAEGRKGYIARVNTGILASGL